jgi:cytochrome c-type biogenesis protein CcmH/NrfG
VNEVEAARQIAIEFTAEGKATPRLLKLVEAAIAEYPNSAALWNLRGDLIQVSDDDGSYSLGDALASYRQALLLDPHNVEAKAEIQSFLSIHGELSGRTA